MKKSLSKNLKLIKRFRAGATTLGYKKWLDNFFSSLGFDAYPARYLTDRRIYGLRYKDMRGIFNEYNKQLVIIVSPKDKK